jgi:hypothetical protein
MEEVYTAEEVLQIGMSNIQYDLGVEYDIVTGERFACTVFEHNGRKFFVLVSQIKEGV